MAIAQWSPAQFIARYPEFTASYNARSAYYANLFLEAGFYLNNGNCSLVQDITRRGVLLNMIVAHIAYIGGALSADGQTRPVGRVSQAAEGTVNASFDWNQLTPGSGPWFQQSQYGAAFWQATAQLRSARYRPRPTYFGQRLPYGF